MVRFVCIECGSFKISDIFKFFILFLESKIFFSLKSDLDFVVM